MTKHAKKPTKPAPTKPRHVAPTAGAHALAALGKQHGWRTLATKTRASEAMLRAVASCQRRAGPGLRTALEGHGVELAAWDRPPPLSVAPVPSAAPGLSGAIVPSKAPVDVGAASGAPGATSAESVGTTVAECEANVARLRRQAEAAAEDPLCSHRDRAAIGSALNHAIRFLARARGEEELSELRIVNSAAFARIRTGIGLVAKEHAGPWVKALRDLLVEGSS